MKTNIIIGNAELLRRLDQEQAMPIAVKFNETERSTHKFTIGQRCKLVGLVDFPEYNGTEVTIDGYRADGPRGTAYYITGTINRFLNWTYEYRLEAA